MGITVTKSYLVSLPLLLLLQISASGPSCSAGDKRPQYRLLWKLEDEVTSWVNYNVAVENFPSGKELKGMVCAVLDQENPEGFQMVRVFFFHSVSGPKLIMDAELARKQFAAYSWNSKLKIDGKFGVLHVYADTKGKEYKFKKRPVLPFDFPTDCESLSSQ